MWHPTSSSMPSRSYLNRHLPLLVVALLFPLTGAPLLSPTAASGAPLPRETRQLLLDTQRVGTSVLDELDAGERVRVLVAFAVENPVDERGLRSKAAQGAIASRRGSVLSGLAPDDVAVVHRYTTVNAFAAEVTLSGLLGLLGHPDVVHVEIDVGGSGAASEGLPLTNVDAVHLLGNTGVGVKVAVLDSGLDTDHPDFAGALVDEQCFCTWRDVFDPTPCCPNASTSMGGVGAAEDDHGHGTHVTGILAGNGSVAPIGGAPDATIVAVKVLSSQNFGLISDWIAALDWVTANHPDVAVVNMSLGTAVEHGDHCDGWNATYIAMATAVDNLRANGALTFVASHNHGFSAGVGFPACLSQVIAVGATYDGDLGSQTHSILGGSCTDSTTQATQISCFSNSGTPLDLVAPGANILSSHLEAGTATLRGTSMATPLAAACGALLRERQPAAALAEVEAAVTGSPTTVVDAKNGLSFPFLDCAAAAALLDGCLPTPRPGCREAAVSSVVWKDHANDEKDTLVWKWKKGEETSQGDFDDPTEASRYQLCAYPGGSAPIAWDPVSAGATNWNAIPLRGYRYTDKNGPSSGVTKIQLIGGPAGKARAFVKAKGPDVPTLALPASLPLTVQLVNRETNECFTSTFEVGHVKKNADGAFKAVAK